MNNLTESDIRYLRDCVLSSTLLGHEVKKGSEVLRKLDKALSLGAVVRQSEQLICPECQEKKELKYCKECFDYAWDSCDGG